MSPRLVTNIGWAVALFMSSAFLSVPAASRADAPPDGTRKPTNVKHAYDVSDLITPIFDFNDAPDLSVPQDQPAKPQNGLFPDPQQEPVDLTREQRVDRLIEWISATVTPEAWKTGSTLRQLKGTLIVDASEPTHQELAAALADLRNRRNVSMALETRMFGTTAKLINQLPPALAKKVRSTIFPMGPQTPLALSDQEYGLLLRISDGQMIAPRVTLFNGQHAYVLVVTQHAFVTGYTPQKAGGGFDPHVQIVEDGTVVNVQATASADLKQAAVHAAIQFTELKAISEAPFAGAAPDKKLMIQTPIRRIHELRTTAAMPTDTMFLIGCMRTVRDDPMPAGAKPMPAKMIPFPDITLVLMRVKVIPADK